MGKSSPSAFLHDLSANRSCFLKYTITENMPQEELERTVEDDFHREFSFILNILSFFCEGRTIGIGSSVSFPRFFSACNGTSAQALCERLLGCRCRQQSIRLTGFRPS